MNISGKLLISMTVAALASHSGVLASNLIQSSGSTEKKVPATATTKANPESHKKTSGGKTKSKIHNVAGTWNFALVGFMGEVFRGHVIMHQAGDKITGIYQTTSRKEDQTEITGLVEGDTVFLKRFAGDGQNYTLTLAPDGKHLEGPGRGWFVDNASMNMLKVREDAPLAVAQATTQSTTDSGATKGKSAVVNPSKVDLSGAWYFSSTWRDWQSGRITLKQSGTQLTGMWHIIKGTKQEDLPLFGNIVDNTVYLTMYNIWGKRENQNKFTLSLLNGGNQLFGYGEGFFINHADLNMARADQTKKAGSKINDAAKPGAKAESKAAEHANAEVPTSQSATDSVTPSPTGTSIADRSKPATVDTTPTNGQVVKEAAAAPVAQVAVTSPPPTPTPPVVQSPAARWKLISSRLESLVTKYYPNAKFVVFEKTIHFEYKAKMVSGYYGESLVPQEGGVIGDLIISSAEQPNQLETKESKDSVNFNRTVASAIYSQECRSKLVSQLTLHRDGPTDFKEEFLQAIAQFKDGSTGDGKAETH